MTIVHALFYILSVLAVCAAFMTVVSTNPVRGVLFLVLTFLASAGLWILLQAEFLGLILVLVYVGAVMTLFLFVVMMLNIESRSGKNSLVRYFPIGVLIIIGICAMLGAVIASAHYMPAATAETNASNISQLGEVLYTVYAYPFEISGVLLLVSIIAAICLSHRPVVDRKIQKIDEQLKVSAKDRLRIVKSSEKKP